MMNSYLGIAVRECRVTAAVSMSRHVNRSYYFLSAPTADSSSTNSTIDSCVKGLNLLDIVTQNHTQPTSTTTYLPPIGVPGNTGRQGLMVSILKPFIRPISV
jgi:hypothetical protein